MGNKTKSIFALFYKSMACSHLEHNPIQSIWKTVWCSFEIVVRVIRNTEQILCAYSLQLFILEKAGLKEVTK